MVGTKKEVSPLKGDPCEVRESAENIQPEVSLADVGERPLARLVYPLVPRKVPRGRLRRRSTTPGIDHYSLGMPSGGPCPPRTPLSP